MSVRTIQTLLLITLAMPHAGCVKQVTPLNSGRLIVSGSANDTVVRSDAGAVTRDASLRFQVESLGSVPTDGFLLPLVSADGMRVAFQQDSNFNWPLLTALPEAALVARGVISMRNVDETDVSHTWDGAYMLGRSCDSQGVLIESPQEDGTRWIGVLPWEGGDARWLVKDAQVNALASQGARGELAWSHRDIGVREFGVTVQRPEGTFEWPRKNDESWLLPIVATDGIFAMRLRDGVLELAYLPLRAGQTMTTQESRPAIIRRSISIRGSENMAYQCVGTLPPDRAVLADGSLLFYHPELGRMAMWQPRNDTLTPLPPGALSATATSDKQLLVTFRDRLATLSLPIDSVRGPVTVIQEPWIARAPSGQGSSAGRIIVLLPGAKNCRISMLLFD